MLSLVRLCSQVLVLVFQIRMVPSSDDDHSIPLLVVTTSDVTALA